MWSVGISRAYSDVAPLLMACQIGAFLEVVHSVLGLVKGDIASSLLQVGVVSGRGYMYPCITRRVDVGTSSS